MVNRVDGNYYNDYSQMKSVNTVSDNGEKFSLDYKQDNLQSEETGKNDKESDAAKAKKKAAERNGVKLELSKAAQQAGTKTEYKTETSKEQSLPEQKSLFTAIQETITGIVQSLKEFFYKIWNDTDEVPETELQTETETEASLNMEKQPIDEEEVLQEALHTGDLPQVISILTENGKKSIAKNSTLLTYYDRNGRVVEPSASDRERILHGDRGSRKL